MITFPGDAGVSGEYAAFATAGTAPTKPASHGLKPWAIRDCSGRRHVDLGARGRKEYKYMAAIYLMRNA